LIAFVLSRGRVIALAGLLFWMYFAAPGTARAQTDSVRVVQPTDSIPVAPAPSDTATTARRIPSPRKALILSAVLPGAGQAYNRRYWKIPLIYIGAGILGYNIQRYYKDYTNWRDAFIAKQKYGVYTLDPLLPGVPRGQQPGQPGCDAPQPRPTPAVLRTQHHPVGVLYALNVVDANVDAHLRGFQLGNQGLSLTPALPTDTPGGAGLTLRFALK
jgi:hypothetical protein